MTEEEEIIINNNKTRKIGNYITSTVFLLMFIFGIILIVYRKRYAKWYIKNYCKVKKIIFWNVFGGIILIIMPVLFVIASIIYK